MPSGWRWKKIRPRRPIGGGTPPSVFANGYSRRRRIWLPARRSATETVSGFVLLVREQGDWLKDVARGGQVESPQGFDLRFEDADGTRLPHDLEHYDPATGTLVAWVRIPSWDIARNLTLFLYYGKSGLAASEADPAATWQDYLAVWDSVTGADRTGNARSLTPSAVTSTTLIGPAGLFNGSADLRRSDASFLSGLSEFFVSTVIQADASLIGRTNPARIVMQGAPTATAGNLGFALFYNHPGFFGGAQKTIKFAVKTSSGSAQVEGPSDLQRTNTMVVAGSWRSGELPNLWIDGQAVTPSWVGLDAGTGGQAGVAATGTTTMVSGQPLTIGVGALNTDRSWIGIIDAVRIKPSVPTAALAELEAENVLFPWRVYAMGAEESPAALDFPPVARVVEATATAGETVDIDVVAAAHDPEGLPLTLASVGSATQGTTAVVSNKARYTPNSSFEGDDEFTFNIRDNANNTGSSKVMVKVRRPSGELPPPLRVVNVSNSSQLSAALSSALPGDEIRLANGTYSGNFSLTKTATSSSPIVVRSATLLGAKITGSFYLGGSFNVLYGIHFDGPSSGVDIDGSNNRVTRCKFSDSTRQAAIRFAPTSLRCRLDHCDVTVRPFDGTEPDRTVRRGVVVDVRDVPLYATVDRNWFHDFSAKPRPDDYWSGFNTPLIVTTTGLRSATPTETIVEYNLFENMADKLGASVATKGSKTIFRFNTLLNVANFLELRAGWESVVWGNWFENTNHLTVRDADHLIANNRFINSSGIYLLAGNQEAKISNDERCRALRARVARNEGTVTVGKQYTAKETYSAKDCVIEAHNGSIVYGLHEGTIVRSTSSVQPYSPRKLARAEVGPFAP